MTFLTFAGPDYRSRREILHASIRKYHPESEIISIDLNNVTFTRGYVTGFHKMKWEKIYQLLLDGYQDIVFIGSDCELFAPLMELERSLAGYDVTIFPHTPVPTKDRESMKQLYATGHANSDCVAIRNTPEAIKIVEWLCSVVEDDCFFDQTWVSSLPFLFDRVNILRDPGYNMGYWRENISLNSVKFFHYSGYKKGLLPRISVHSDKIAEGKLLTLLEEYDRKL